MLDEELAEKPTLTPFNRRRRLTQNIIHHAIDPARLSASMLSQVPQQMEGTNLAPNGRDDDTGLGISLKLIDRCQNHVLADSKVRRHYLHHDFADEKQDAWRALGARLAEIGMSSYLSADDLADLIDCKPTASRTNAQQWPPSLHACVRTAVL